MEEIKITQKTVTDNIMERNKDNLNNVAFENLGKKLTYKQYFDLIDRLAKAYLELGLQEGDIVTLSTAGTVDAAAHFYALNRIGAVAQLVNPNFLKLDSKKYIDETGSKTLVVLDRFYPELKDALMKTNVENIILSSLTEESSYLYKAVVRRRNLKKDEIIEDVNYLTYPEFAKMGDKYNKEIEAPEYIKERDAAIMYTSGTTGNPKGVLIHNDGFNNMISIYDAKNGFGSKKGDRNLVVIPPMYLTSLSHCINTPLAFGCVNVMQPLYNPDTFLKNLKKYEPNIVVGSKAHYIGLLNQDIKKGSLSFLNMAFTGGEAINKKLAIDINEKLKEAGVKQSLIIGYGMTEFGSMTMFNMDIEDRTNESGKLMPYVEAKIENPVTKEEVGPNELGILKISSPCMMKKYLNNEEATDKFIEYDNMNKKWGNTNDIATVDENGVYRVLGRASDTIIDDDGKITELFTIEDFFADSKYVQECEVVALTIDDKKVPIVHVVLEKNAQPLFKDIIKLIDLEYKEEFGEEGVIPYAYKVRENFPTSPISGKRDSETIKYETDGYFRVYNGKLVEVNINSKEFANKSSIEKIRKLKL